jgi:hypothetical protein
MVQLSLFDEQDSAEITHPDYPGERPIVCRNPLLAAAQERQPIRSAETIGYLVGKALGPSKGEQCFQRKMTPHGLRWRRDPERIQRDADLDGIYVLRTSVAEQFLDRDQAVLAYKRRAVVERAFRSLKSVDLNVRPTHHRVPDRVRAHVVLAMLAYHAEWHMRQALAPVLFGDEQRDGSRPSVVAPAVRSPEARAKARTKRTTDGWPVRSLQDWLNDLATIVKNRIQPRLRSLPTFDMTTRPTASQRYALELLRVRLVPRGSQ